MELIATQGKLRTFNNKPPPQPTTKKGGGGGGGLFAGGYRPYIII